MTRIGIDVGSTTAKIVALHDDGTVLFSRYARHNTRATETVAAYLDELLAALGGDDTVSLTLTGSVGMGIAERYGLPFVQEVVAAAHAIQAHYPAVTTMIDIGGEDAKVVFFKEQKAVDLRMNGNCAGGTGAFIDQMAVILNVSIAQLNSLALAATRTYPIASRCGVFCKTDIQNLLANNVCREDIAASIFHAVAIQTVVTLAKGFDITPPVLFCGGPLTFIPALRKAFADYLHLSDDDIITPSQGALLPALGAALSLDGTASARHLSDFIALLRTAAQGSSSPATTAAGIAPIFATADDYALWQQRLAANRLRQAPLVAGSNDVFLGIDSGSTTTKIVVVNKEKEILFSYYSANGGNPIHAVEEGLRQLQAHCAARHATLHILGSGSTGYGEDLIRAAFSLHTGIIETIAHYLAARHFDPAVSFVLDIGGQDMKAIFVDNGIIDRIEINEACSSGCGSFIETFAKTLGYTAHEFAAAACRATAPCDLGTRCTVFMNSKVKQALREGATIGDIAAGLAVSVVKNCLYKVLKLKDVSALGKHIVVQGGTMRNDAVVRALEQLTTAEVRRSDMPELMGAFGAALYAMQHATTALSLDDIISKAHYAARTLHCKGCHNQCAVTRYRFDNGGTYYAGNKCEKVFTNGTREKQRGTNTYLYKYDLLFSRSSTPPSPRLTIGIPRVLNMYEEYPFWHALFCHCGIRVVLSAPSEIEGYEASARMVMSDNICFPAKLVHSHINDLISRGVDRIFLPFVIHEVATNDQNSYNCPVVTGYSAVVHATQPTAIPVDSPAISFKDTRLLQRQCEDYLCALGIEKKTVREALVAAQQALDTYAVAIAEQNRQVLRTAQEAHRLVILLAGRPYHSDPLIQHDVSEMIADLGIDVITDDIARHEQTAANDTNLVAQWAYPNRILRAAQWAATQGADVQFVQMTSFGCGPDAFLTDELRDLLLRHNKPFTLLKLDDISNIGSMKLRVRSLVESLKLRNDAAATPAPRAVQHLATTAIYTKEDRRRTILAPFFTPFISPVIPAALRLAGYNVENLPLSDSDSVEWGLRYANNEVCYPATLIVGDVVKAFVSGKHKPEDCAVAITQTGGQCRASNYVALIKKALADAGYPQVPVITVSFGEDLGNEQPGWKVNWLKLMPTALRAMLFTDSIAKFYYAARVREKETQQGQAARLKDRYLAKAEELIAAQRANELFDCLEQAASDFDAICCDKDCPKVGIVGEIFLKFNSFSHKNVIDWLIDKGVEVMPPILMDFFLQAFVNRKINTESHIEQRHWTDFLYSFAYSRIRRQIAQVNSIGQRFRYFTPFCDIFKEADKARHVITLNAQFGEGWLLPGEVMSFAANGIRNVISLQPFGCIANHIISRGIERRIKQFYPDINLLSLDFDSGVSDVNVTNRMLLFVDNLQPCEQTKENG